MAADDGCAHKRARTVLETESPQSDDATDASSCSDVVVRILGGGEKKGEDTDSLDVHLHRSVLVEKSSFFAAQLSDRWEGACTRDASGRPLLELKDCGDPRDCAAALRKLDERAPGDPEKCPMQSFEDALRCLKPADQLGLSSVWASAVAYLESVSWTEAQSEALREAVALVGHTSAKALLGRTEPPTEAARAALLDALLSRAAASGDTAAGARAYVEKMIAQARSSRAVTAFVAAGLQRCLQRLAESNPFHKGYQNTYSNNITFTKTVDKLAWLFQLPESPIQDGIRRGIVSMMLKVESTNRDSGYYKRRLFHRFIAEKLYLPVMEAVANGTLVVDTDLRMGLLKMWVPSGYAFYYDEDVRYTHSIEMQAAFIAVLSTVDYQAQEQVLHDWLKELMEADPFEPWFKDWMDKSLLAGWD